MKYVKILGLLAVAAAALMAFAGTAAATKVTTTTGGAAATPTIHAVTSGHAILHGALGTVECNSTVEGSVTAHGAGVAASGPIKTLTFTGCTGTNTVTSVPKTGSLAVNYTSGHNGTLTSTGAEVVVFNHSFGGTCIFTTNNTAIGTVTGGNPATLHIAATIPRTGGTAGAFCGSTGTWTGTYNTTSALYIGS